MLDKHQEEFIRMGVPNMQGEISEDEVEVAQIYCVLVLKKVSINRDRGSDMDDDEDDYGDYNYDYNMDANECEDLNETIGKLPKDISEDDIVNLLKYTCLFLIQVMSFLILNKTI